MAAQDAELKLKVSLDLGFFRQQLTGLGQAAAGYNLPIKVQFDRRSVQNELNALGANIRRRSYTLNVNTNLKAEIENASKLAKALDELSKSRGGAQKGISQQLGLGQLLKAPQSGGLGSKDVERLYRAAARAGILEYSKEVARTKASAVAALEAVGSESVRGLLNGLKSEDEKLRAAAEYLGESLIKTVKDVLGIASPSREFKKIGQNVGEGFQQGMMSSMDKAFDAVEGLMRARMKVLDTIARGMFRMAGIDPVAIRAEAAQRRALPGVNFPATVPRQNIPIGPSSTGRALPPGAIPSALPGTAFTGQRYLPTALSDELKKILRGAAFAFVDSLKQQVRSTRIGIAATQQPLLGASRIAGLLPAGVGRTPSTYSTGAIGGETREQMMARRTAEAYARSALRGMDVMGGGAGRPPSPYSYAYRSARPTSAIVPYAAGGAMVPVPSMAGGGGAVPPSGGGGGRGGFGGLGGFGRAMGGVNLPGAGTIRELGSEFAFATKQVLLFGQAYKMLGFLQDFPGQVGQAVAQLQSFRNTLNTVATSAEDASESNQLILDLVEKYNVPLQSARDGFTKLYASMAPAGFSGDEIRDLFTGITQAAATFGMSADKVDRVNYAFAQMASKGQVMSEELKGQLGDVLPGAMALFAEAAGFEGPKAIQEFSAALEDGVYKGEAMNILLKNVGIVMKQEFGPGAEGAARTFQGVINRMQNSMQLLYESFEPVAIGFLNSVVMPLTEGIKTVSDGFTAFFTGTAAKTAGGFAIAQELEKLRPALDGIRQNISGLAEQFGQFARVAGEVGKVFLQIAGNPVVGYLARVYANVLILTTAIQVLNLKALIPMIASLGRSAYALIAFTAQCVRAGQSAQVMGLMVKTAGITLRTFFASTGVGIVIVGISMLIEKFMSMNHALDQTKQKALGAAQAIRAMSQTEARRAEQEAQTAYQTISRLAGRPGQNILGTSDRIIELTPQELKQLQGLGPLQTAKDPLSGRITARRSDVMSLAPQAQRLKAEADYRVRESRFEEQQAQKAAVLAPIPEVAAEGGAAGKAGKELGEYDRSQLTFIQQQFEKEKQILDKKLQGELISQTQYDIALAELKLETERLEIAEKYRLAVEKTNKDNLSSADKALKLKDLEIAKNNDLAIAEENRNIAIGAARQKIIAPILSELDNETAAIERQTAQANALKEGRLNLSAAQEAELSVKERYLSLSQDERELAKGELEILRQIREQRLRNAEALQLQMSLQEKINETRGIGGGLRAGFFGQAAGVFERAMFESGGNVDYATQMANLETAAMQLRSVFEGLQSAIGGVSEAFANVLTEGVAGMIAGTATAKEVFADFLRSIGQSLLQAASQMIATYIAIGIAKAFAGLGGGGSAENNLDVSGFKKYPMLEGPGFTPFANGGIALGGFQAFANGGVVSGPTLGLIGEGKYNEAVVPLPDGRSIPVQLGGRSARDLMGNGAPGMPQAPSLSMKFETTKINGVEYVSREQLEQAMAETRRASIAGGAKQGMSMTLDKIKQSPSTRSRIGIR